MKQVRLKVELMEINFKTQAFLNGGTSYLFGVYSYSAMGIRIMV